MICNAFPNKIILDLNVDLFVCLHGGENLTFLLPVCPGDYKLVCVAPTKLFLPSKRRVLLCHIYYSLLSNVIEIQQRRYILFRVIILFELITV
jgi:hypothetical protein